MKTIIVKKSPSLSGEVSISGSKNSALPVLAASLLAEDDVILENVPSLSDTDVMKNLLFDVGAEINEHDGVLNISCRNIKNNITQHELASRMRGSFLLAGSMLARTGYAKISLPGGCPIGTRPIDLHLKGFASMGALIERGHGFVEIKAKQLKGARIYLDFPSVGATENIIMAACRADGTTIIENAAAEPEITDLANFLNTIGAEIKGAGGDTIEIKGKKTLKGGCHRIIPDRIEAGSFLAAFAMTGGTGIIKNIIPAHTAPITAKLTEMGADIDEGEDFIKISAPERLKASDIKTMPFPGFPTDMQAQFTAMLTSAEGTSIIIETVFENRFLHAVELNRMGAKIKVDGRTEVVEGGAALTGARVRATDLRAGAALILAGLISSGETVISDIEHISRGYDSIVEKLRKLGGIIEYADL
ncbi:MAG: UDP-N-acetylglucosamine 1-carboxyvinyltransferase [Oscillospiraceae bacterium]|nr:UDP-N-acetylglucosamine 1-carboxyvinyltransferase [Oscillospiraceae bacterium]